MGLLIVFLFLSFFTLSFVGIVDFHKFKGKFPSSILFWGTSIILIFIAGFREVGLDPDSKVYLRYYGSDDIFLLAEPTFVFISYIVRNTFNNFQFVLIIYAIIGVFLKYKAINLLTDLKYLSLILYFSTFYILHEITQIRAGVAAGFFLLSIVPLSDRRIWRYIFIISIACLFHYSSIILFSLCFITNDHLNKTGKALLYISIPFGIVLYYQKFDIMLSIPIETIKYKIEIYKATQEHAEVILNVFNLVYVVKYLLFYFLLFFYETIYKQEKYVSILLKLYGLSLFSYLLLSQNTIFAMRISELIGIVEILLIPMIYYIFKQRVFGSILVIVISVIYLYINIFYTVLIQST